MRKTVTMATIKATKYIQKSVVRKTVTIAMIRTTRSYTKLNSKNRLKMPQKISKNQEFTGAFISKQSLLLSAECAHPNP